MTRVIRQFSYLMLAELVWRLTPHGCWQCRFLPRHRGEPSIGRHVVPRASHPTVTGHACQGRQLLAVQQVTASNIERDKARMNIAIYFILLNTSMAIRVAPEFLTLPTALKISCRLIDCQLVSLHSVPAGQQRSNHAFSCLRFIPELISIRLSGLPTL